MWLIRLHCLLDAFWVSFFPIESFTLLQRPVGCEKVLYVVGLPAPLCEKKHLTETK